MHKREIELVQNFSTITIFRCTAAPAETTQKSEKLFSLRHIWRMNSAKKSPVKKAVLVTRTKLQVGIISLRNSVADLGGAPPTVQNVLNFMQFSGKFGKIVCWHPPGWLTPPPTRNPGSAAGIFICGYRNLR